VATTSPALYLFLLEPPNAVPSHSINSSLPAPVPADFPAQNPALSEVEETAFNFREAGLLPWSPLPVPRQPNQRPKDSFPRLIAAKPVLLEPELVPYTPCLVPDPPPPFVNRVGALALKHWKVFLAVVPLGFVAFIDSSPAHTAVQKPGAQVQKAQKQSTNSGTAPMLSSWRNAVRRRAAVQFSDDFRSGLDDWQSNQNLATSWTYDESGFVRPGVLAVYRPTMELEDYTVEFLGQIEQKGMGMAFRVMDWNHYYAIKLNVVKPGPMAAIELVRYAVEGNREVARFSRHISLIFHDTSLCRFRLDVHGNQFTLMNQGQIVDDWTDDRYPRGGVGFFCGKGERARLRWVEVSHQNDPVGRLAALLAPQ
jgi:hypothetical protein